MEVTCTWKENELDEVQIYFHFRRQNNYRHLLTGRWILSLTYMILLRWNQFWNRIPIFIFLIIILQCYFLRLPHLHIISTESDVRNVEFEYESSIQCSELTCELDSKAIYTRENKPRVAVA